MPTPEEYIDFLILNGAVEVSGVDSNTGDFTYQFTDKMFDIAPNVYEQMQKQFQADIMSLWTKGLVSMDPTIENPIVGLTKKAFDRDQHSDLSDTELEALNNVKRMFLG